MIDACYYESIFVFPYFRGFSKYKNKLKAFPVILKKKDKRWLFIGNHIHDDRVSEGTANINFKCFLERVENKNIYIIS